MSLDRWFATTLAGIAMLLHGGVIFGQESDGPAKPTVDAAAKKAGLFHQQVQATPQNPAADSPPRTTKTIPVSAPQPTVSQPVVQQVVTQAVPVAAAPIVQAPGQQILVQPSAPQIVMLPAQPPTVSVAQPVAMQTAVQQVASPQPQNLFVQSPQHPVASPQSHQVQSAPQQQPQVVQYVQQQPQMVQYVPQQQPLVQAGGGAAPGSALLLRCPGIIDGLLGWLGQGLTSVGQRMASRGAPRQVMALSYNPAYVQVPVAQQVQSVAPQPQVQYVQQPVVSSPPPVTASPQSSQGHHWGLGLFHHD
jgi:hypothetical protein